MFLATLPLFAVGLGDLWYALPLIVAISLVYSGTRHEAVTEILSRAWHMAVWIVAVMAAIFLVLLLISWWL
jgi:Na+/alanine symporter